jgi:hypothetical protein
MTRPLDRTLPGLTFTAVLVCSTPVTGAGLKKLAGLKHLHTLDLRGTRITEAHIKELARLKSLRVLILDVMQLTESSRQDLRERLPTLRIIH